MLDDVSSPSSLEASLQMTGQSCSKDCRVKPDNDELLLIMQNSKFRPSITAAYALNSLSTFSLAFLMWLIISCSAASLSPL